jgi:predicted transcriptional regulator
LNSTPKRSKIAIVAEMLDFCLEPRRKTRILYKAGLSLDKGNRYMTYLLQQGFLKNSIVTETKLQPYRTYTTTPSGKQLLEAISNVEDLMNESSVTIPFFLKSNGK